MIHTTTQPNSEEELMSQVYKLTDAGAPIIQIKTREPYRTAHVLRKSILSSDENELREWDAINGFRSFTLENYTDNKIAGDNKDFMKGIMTPLQDLRNASSSARAKPNTLHYFVFIDAHPYIANNAFAAELLQQYAAILPSTNICLLFVTPDITLDNVPMGTILVSSMPTPSTDELSDVLKTIIEGSVGDFDDGSELDDEDIRRISLLGLGLTLYEFETYAAISIINAHNKGQKSLTLDAMIEGVSEGKTAIVKQSEILELYPNEKMENVGGMQKLKDWVASRANCYSEEAKAYGIEPPKGCVLVGVPGAGKSLVAKAIASVLAVPLVKMDFGRVFSKYVGDSESRVRSALQMVEDMAPVVLFVDEIDKGLGGIGGGGGDSGTSSRVLGSFLTWLQECKAPVFVLVTANKVDGLPPELLRRGRFDQIFSVSLPTASERIEVLEIHLRKRDKEFNFSEKDLYAFTSASDGYVPAEIESAVKDGMIMAFADREQIGMKHILSALREMVPMSRSYAPQIASMVEWARNNATSVNYDESETPATSIEPPSRRVARRSR